MPRDLFGDVTDPSVRVGGRKWYTVPLSLAVHTIALLTVVAIPLLATGTLPLPRSTVVPVVLPPEMPAPPPVRRATPQTTPAANPHAAPLETPQTIEAENPFDLPVLDTAPDGLAIPGVDSIDGIEAVIAPPAPKPPPPQKPVRVGPHIRAPEKVRDVAPVYPPLALTAHVEGVVIIEATIGVDGRVENARVLRSHPLLDEAAVAAVRQWVYTPTLLNGVPVPVIMTVTVQFRIR
jgi:periplasmic protein TonB